LSEPETKSVIKKIYKNQGILIDPHTAVAIGVSDKIPLKESTIILATAHSSKFSDTIMQETNIKPELPESLKNILSAKENYIKLPKELTKIKNYILERI
jgi:threonine synthase